MHGRSWVKHRILSIALEAAHALEPGRLVSLTPGRRSVSVRVGQMIDRCIARRAAPRAEAARTDHARHHRKQRDMFCIVPVVELILGRSGDIHRHDEQRGGTIRRNAAARVDLLKQPGIVRLTFRTIVNVGEYTPLCWAGRSTALPRIQRTADGLTSPPKLRGEPRSNDIRDRGPDLVEYE